jgi:hypothetical protein
MTPSFAERAVRLAGIAGAIAGWPPDVFWRATPADLETVLLALIGGTEDRLPPSRVTIAGLKERFPDG